MKKKEFLLGAEVGHGKGNPYQERSFLMSIVQMKMRIPLVHPNKMRRRGKRSMMKTLL